MFPAILRNALWHTTNDARFDGIKSVGAILPNPSLPESERWGVASGPNSYPYARSLGGVSLFDFFDFEEEQYRLRYPQSNFDHFVPCRSEWPAAIWIELDSDRLKSGLVLGPGLLGRWESDRAFRHRLMPLIEAAHIGPVPLQACRRVLRYVNGEWCQLDEVDWASKP